MEKTFVLPQLQLVEKNVAIPMSSLLLSAGPDASIVFLCRGGLILLFTRMSVYYFLGLRLVVVTVLKTADFPQFQLINKVINIPCRGAEADFHGRLDDHRDSQVAR